MSETMTVYTTSELDLGSCVYTRPEKFDNYHKSFINVNGVKGFVLQSPKVVLRNSTDSYLEFLVSRNKDRHRDFYNIISHLEDTAIIQTTEKSKEWFNSKISRDQVETMFRSCIHRPLDINDSYILRVNKVAGLDAEVNFPIVCLLKIEGIVFGKNTFTLDIKVVQTKVIKTEKIASDDISQSSSVVVQNTKPFYSDTASIVSHNYLSRNDNPVYTQKIDTIVEEMEQEPGAQEPEPDAQSPELFEAEKVCEVKTIQCTENNGEIAKKSKIKKEADTDAVESVTDVVSVEDVVLTEDVTLTEDTLKYEIIKAMGSNDYTRVKELSELLNSLKIN